MRLWGNKTGASELASPMDTRRTRPEMLNNSLADERRSGDASKSVRN
jgi:hypothetical protein